MSTLGLTFHRNCFMLWWPSPGITMVNGNCAVVGCRNSNYRLKQWKKKDCTEHKDRSHRNCSCPRPFTLRHFPSKLLTLERRNVWIHKMRTVSARNTT